MSDNVIHAPARVPAQTVQPIAEEGQDGPLYLVAVNGENGLETQVVDVRELAPKAFPPRTVADRTVTDIDSFVAEIGRRPLPEGLSTIWGNRERGEIVAVYDELPKFTHLDYTRRADRLVLKFVDDPDWATLFKAADGKYHDQEEFGELIEYAGHLITSHSDADLIEIVDSIRASKSGAFESRIRRDTGSQHLTFKEEVSASAGTSTKPLEVPREITLAASPFESYPEVQVTCWLRLRVNGGQLGLGLFPKPYKHLVRDAWKVVTGDIADQLKVPVYAANVGR